MRKPQYKTLVEYMEKTNTSAVRLIQMLRDRERVSISPSLFSMILRGSRRCSIVNAWAIHQVTGVPMEELTRWPRYAKNANSQSAA